MNAAAPPGWRGGTIHAAGVALAAFEAGSSDPRAPVVLLLHGLGHWSEGAWAPLVPQLDPALRYVAFDLPGFGASDKPAVAYDLDFFRRVLDGAVAALGLERFALLGHSLGGFLAADYAGRCSERVAALALIAPAAFARAPRYIVYALASSAARWLFTRKPSRTFVVGTMRRAVVNPTLLDPATLDRAYALSQDLAVREAFAGVYSGAIQAFAHARTLHAGFARYTGPVFCAWGAHDRFIPVAALRQVQRVYPHAQTLVLQRSAHLPMIEEPAALATALREFLAAT